MAQIDTAVDIRQLRLFNDLGPLKQYLDDPLTQNINVSRDGTIHVERFGSGKHRAPEKMEETKRKALLSYLANHHGKVINHLQASFSATMPYYGSRVRGFADPIGGWSIMIRQHTPTIPFSELLTRGLLTQQHADTLLDAVLQEKNMIIAGKMNSGKTAFLRSLLGEVARLRPDARPIIIQSDDEIQAEGFHDKQFFYANVEQAMPGLHGTVSRYLYGFSDALHDALQANGDFLVWGELRDGKSASALMLALNTGTRGLLTTMHSDSCEETLQQLEALIAHEGKPVVKRMIGKFVNLIVHMSYDRKTGKRWVSDLCSVVGIDQHGTYILGRNI